jgi:integrase
MARLESDHGRLLVSFQYNGARCREYLGLNDTRDNRRTGARTVNEIECELKAGKFDYAARFPESRRLERFGISPPARPPAPKPAEERADAPSLGKFAEAWLEERRAVLTLATAYDYDRLIKALLLPSPLAQKRIDEVNDGDIHLFMGQMSRRKTRSGQPVGPRRINMIIARLRTIFATAKRRKLVPEDPMLFVQNLREPKAEVDPFELEEAVRLINSATGQDRAIITVLIFCGLRPNEALALRWQDVDFGRRILKIRRTIHRFGGIGLPKTASSERDVDMLDPVIVELEEQRARTQMRGELVFLNDVRGPVDLTNFRDRNWKRILIRARLRARTIYQCRHTFAALQLSRGENPQYVAHQMGHTNLEMIIRHYARWSRKPERVGTLAHQLSAQFPQILPEKCQKLAAAEAPSVRGASRRSSQTADSTTGNRGAGDRGRTGDVQLGKLAFYH